MQHVESIAVIVSAIATALAAVFVAQQVSLMRQGRDIDTFLNILNFGNQDFVREAADWIKYEMDQGLPYDRATADGLAWSRIAVVNHYFEMGGC